MAKSGKGMFPAGMAEEVRGEAGRLIALSQTPKYRRTVFASSIAGRIEAMCRRGAINYGVAEYWREIYPADLFAVKES